MTNNFRGFADTFFTNPDGRVIVKQYFYRNDLMKISRANSTPNNKQSSLVTKKKV